MDVSSTELQLTEWVQDWSESGAPVEATTELRNSGIMDSIGVVGLVARIEDLTGATFDLDTFDFSSTVSVRSLLTHCLAT